MGQWIRWKGFIAFLVLITLLGAFWFFAVDSLTVRIIEKTGTELVGAKVELGDAEVTLFPLGLNLQRLQVTNPDQGMENAVEIAMIAFNLDAPNLLRRKVIVENMALSGVEFNTPRSVSGTLPRREERVETDPETGLRFELPSFAVPDVKEILAGEDLESVRQIEMLEREIQALRDGWQQRLGTLPDKGKLDGYKARIEALRKSGSSGIQGVLQKGGEAKTLQEELQRDQKAVTEALKDSKETLRSVKDRVADAKNAPLADLERIKERYALSPQGLANFSRLLLGGKIAAALDTALSWYRRLGPLYAQTRERTDTAGPEIIKPLRAKGVDVRFRERDALPDFLVRDTKLSLLLDAGEFKGAIKNLTHQQNVLGLPMTFTISGRDLPGVGEAKVDGALDHVSPANPKDAFQVQVSGYEARDVILSDAVQLPVTLQQGLADFKVEGLIQGEDLSVGLTAALHSTDLALGSSAGKSRITEALGSALSSVSAFGLSARITGTLEQYGVEVTSDLDNVFKDAIGNLARDEAARLEKELMPAIMAKVDGPLAALQGGLGGLETVTGEIAGRGDVIDKLLDSLLANTAPKGLKLPF